MTEYEVRKLMMIAQYQYGMFKTERKKQEAKYEHWKANQKNRAQQMGLKYLDRDELSDAYILGAIDEETFKKQRRLFNLIIADCWHRAEKLDWLRENEAHYQREYEALARFYEEKKKDNQRAAYRKYMAKKNGIRKRTYDVTKNRSKYNQPYTGKRRWEYKAERKAALAAEQEKQNGGMDGQDTD